MKRKSAKVNGLTISYLDNEKTGPAMVCLHGHFGTASMLKFFETIYAGRLIIPDLRGQGLSEHAASYKRDDYINDLKSLIDTLKLKNPILFGHSLGGITILQYASIYQNTSKIIIEDIGTEVSASNEFLANFPEVFDSIWDVNNEFVKQGRPLSTYFMESLYYDDLGWKFRFGYKNMIQSQQELNGDYWAEWENIKCPIL